MKRNKKGFTLVELVIVIAVIAILAGVMIAIFSGVIKRANENAELQQVKNDELKQKAEDVLTKLDNANWFSWEDFENSLAAKLTEAYKNSTAAQLTTEQIQDAVKKALEDYAKNNASENSQLTEAQVKVIIENAISEAKLGGVTEAQVRTIVNTAVGSINTVSKADIQRIVDAATSKGLTAEQVAKVINDAGLATSAQLENVSAKVQSAVDAINALKPVTKKDVSDAIIDLVPVTYTINTADDLADALARVKSFSTLNFTSEYTTSVGNVVVITLPESDDRVLTIKGVKLEDLTVNAPGATVYLATEAGNVLVTATAGNSFHVVKNVETLTVNKGRVVVEDNAVVTTLTALPSTDVTVTVRIEEEGTVKNLFAQYQDHGYNDNHRDFITVENNGNVGTSTITASAALQSSNTTTTNVTIKNGPNAKGTEINDVKVSDTYTDENGDEVTAAVPAVKVSFVDNATGEETTGTANNTNGRVEEGTDNLLGIKTVSLNPAEVINVYLPIGDNGYPQLQSMNIDSLVPFEFKFPGGVSFVAPESIDDDWKSATADFVISFNKNITPINTLTYSYNGNVYNVGGENNSINILPIVPVGKFGSEAQSFWEVISDKWLPCPLPSNEEGYKANTDIALLTSVFGSFGFDGVSVNCEELVGSIKEFSCGLVFLEDIGEVTITVSLVVTKDGTKYTPCTKTFTFNSADYVTTMPTDSSAE